MPTRNPSLLSLKAFEAVARHGSFKLAADELCVTAGALSQHVKKLEDNIGFHVLKRSHRSVELTGKGKELYDTLKDAFICINEKLETLRVGNHELPVRVSCGYPVAAKWLAPRLNQLSQRFPDIEIEIISHRELVNYQLERIDIGIRLSRDEDPTLSRTWMHEESVIPVCSPNYAKQLNLREPKDILRATLLKDDGLSYCRGSIWQIWCDEANVDKSLINKSIDFKYSPEQALDAAIADAGVMIASKTLAGLDIKKGNLVIPFGPEVSTHVKYQIVTPILKIQRPQVVQFRDWLIEEFTPYDEDSDSILVRKTSQ